MAVFLGGYVAAPGAWTGVWLAAIATLLVTSSSNAWNDYLDIDIDRINRPDRVLPSGQLSGRGSSHFFSLSCRTLARLCSVINLPAFLIALFSNIMLYIYSWKLKSTVLLGNAVSPSFPLQASSLAALQQTMYALHYYCSRSFAPSLWRVRF